MVYNIKNIPKLLVASSEITTIFCNKLIIPNNIEAASSILVILRIFFAEAKNVPVINKAAPMPNSENAAIAPTPVVLSNIPIAKNMNAAPKNNSARMPPFSPPAILYAPSPVMGSRIIYPAPV